VASNLQVINKRLVLLNPVRNHKFIDFNNLYRNLTKQSNKDLTVLHKDKDQESMEEKAELKKVEL
jgi:hypothetical protein